MNYYINLAEAKFTATNKQQTDMYDAEMLTWIGVVSDGIERFCRRKFYPEIATKEFYHYGGRLLLTSGEDLISVTGLEKDGSLWQPTYRLWPLNGSPKWAVYAEGYNHGLLDSYAVGREPLISINAKWGHSENLKMLPMKLTSGVNDSVTEFSLASQKLISAGTMLRIGDEYICVVGSNADGSALEVERGYNGSEGESHATTDVLYRVMPPAVVTGAARAQFARLWKRRETAFSNVSLNSDMGTMEVFKELDGDVKMMLSSVARAVEFA